jgi:multiple sugar transport system permease protein
MAVEQTTNPAIAGPVARPAAAATASRQSPVGIVQRVLYFVLLIGFTILFVYPFIWLVSASLKEGSEVFNREIIPDPIVFENYSRLLELVPRFPQWAYNSVVVSLLAAGTVTLSSAFVAFGFSYFRFPGRNILFGVLLASMMLPGVVTMIPTFLIWDALGFYNTLTPLWAGNLFASAFYVFLLRQFFLGLPRELFEAARVDGANYLRMWWNIAIPLTLPALIVVFVFELKAAWTDLFKPLIFLQDPALYTLSRGLKAVIDNPSIGGAKEWELLAVAGVITTIPMIIVFFIGQRYFIEGIATTGSKG